LDNADVFFGTELPVMATYAPNEAELAEVETPVYAVAGSPDRPDHLRYQVDTTAWVAEALRTEVIEIPGWHVPYLSHTQGFVSALRPLLRKLDEEGSDHHALLSRPLEAERSMR
jgi:hypothetical protein